MSDPHNDFREAEAKLRERARRSVAGLEYPHERTPEWEGADAIASLRNREEWGKAENARLLEDLDRQAADITATEAKFDRAYNAYEQVLRERDDIRKKLECVQALADARGAEILRLRSEPNDIFDRLRIARQSVKDAEDLLRVYYPQTCATPRVSDPCKPF